MAEITGSETEFKGAYGRSRLVPLPAIPQTAETVCVWLLTAPGAHPLWTQYRLGCVRLRDLDGWPPPKRHFDGASHEILVVALNPEHGPYTVEKMENYFRTGRMPYLTPVNVVHQLQGTDDEARLLTGYAAMGVAHGFLSPEPDGWHAWDVALIKTLAHVRGEEHAQ